MQNQHKHILRQGIAFLLISALQNNKWLLKRKSSFNKKYFYK